MNKIQLTENLHFKIRKIRLEKGYSQEYMAECLKISQNTYSRIEAGEIKLFVNRLIIIASILEISFYGPLPEKDLFG